MGHYNNWGLEDGKDRKERKERKDIMYSLEMR
jgi:hypothetical protein